MIGVVSDFKFEITRSELVSHLTDRVKHHEKKAEKYHAKAKSVREKFESGKDVLIPQEIAEAFGGGPQDYMSMRGGMHARNLKDQINAQVERMVQILNTRANEHAQSATRLTWYLNHLPRPEHPLPGAIGRDDDRRFELGTVDLEVFELLADQGHYLSTGPRIPLMGMSQLPAGGLGDWVDQEAF